MLVYNFDSGVNFCGEYFCGNFFFMERVKNPKKNVKIRTQKNFSATQYNYQNASVYSFLMKIWS